MVSLSTIVREVLVLDPSAPALEYEKAWHSWGELTAIIEGVEFQLAENGIGSGARIGGILRNVPQIAAMIIGTIINDRCVVTLNPSLPDSKLVNDIVSLKTPVIIAHSLDWARPEIREAAKTTGALCLEITDDRENPVKKIFDKTGDDFNIDAEGHVLDESMGEALAGLHRFSPKVSFLGSYPRADKQQTKPEGNNSNGQYADAKKWLEGIRRAK
jgi:acyl-CoA synthetase (AMP-forming)/AMP-acid ligase II